MKIRTVKASLSERRPRHTVYVTDFWGKHLETKEFYGSVFWNRHKHEAPHERNDDPPVERVAGDGPHAVLGVRSDASSDEIRSAYRALALKHHPDHGGSVERMREINLAYAAIAG